MLMIRGGPPICFVTLTHRNTHSLTIMAQQDNPKDIKGNGLLQLGCQPRIIRFCSAYTGDNACNTLYNRTLLVWKCVFSFPLLPCQSLLADVTGTNTIPFRYTLTQSFLLPLWQASFS